MITEDKSKRIEVLSYRILRLYYVPLPTYNQQFKYERVFSLTVKLKTSIHKLSIWIS